MSRKESFSVEKPKSRSSEHNNRTDKPKYLIEPNPSFNGNFYKRYNHYENDKQYKIYAQDHYKEEIGQSMQEIQKPAIIKEVIVTLKKEHDEHTVLKLFAHLEEKYGGHQVLELAIHHDEGHFEDEEGLTYYPNNDIFYNIKDKKWYLDKSLQEAAPKNFKKIYNYHAHVKFTMMDKATAKTPQMPKKLYSQRHKVVAELLGLRYAPGESRFHKKDIAQVKEEHSENRHKEKIRLLEKKKLKETIVELEQKLIKKRKVDTADLAKLKEEFRKEMISSELFFKKEDYQALNKLFEDAKSDNQTMELSLTKLQEEIEALKEDKTKYRARTKELEVDIKTFKDSDLDGYKNGVKTGNKLTYKRLVELRDKKIEALNEENELLKEHLQTTSMKKEELSETITTLEELSYLKKQETDDEGNISNTIVSYKDELGAKNIYIQHLQNGYNEIETTLFGKNNNRSIKEITDTISTLKTILNHASSYLNVTMKNFVELFKDEVPTKSIVLAREEIELLKSSKVAEKKKATQKAVKMSR